MKRHVIKSKMDALKVTISGILLTLAMPFSAFAVSSTVYDATPSTLPPNVASLGYEATSTSQFGDYVHLAGKNRILNTVTVTMSDWALFADYAHDNRYSGNSISWTHPITINVYSNHLVNGVPDQLLATKTQDVVIPWRPEGNPSCGLGWKASDGECYNGIAFNAAFDLSSSAVKLPKDVIVGIAYNTADYGAVPIHTAGPYNSLNVGIPDNQTVSAGSDDNTDAVFWDTTYPGYTAGFKLDNGWSPNGTVALKITTIDPKDLCKDNGWKNLGLGFKNQGECVSYLATDGKNVPAF
jgi:hypothetical protein